MVQKEGFVLLNFLDQTLNCSIGLADVFEYLGPRAVFEHDKYVNDFTNSHFFIESLEFNSISIFSEKCLVLVFEAIDLLCFYDNLLTTGLFLRIFEVTVFYLVLEGVDLLLVVLHFEEKLVVVAIEKCEVDVYYFHLVVR